jgi:hypothetical protein
MTEQRFIQEYSEAKMQGYRDDIAQGRMTQQDAQAQSVALARRALGLAQTSLGARVGTSSMRIAAQQALLKSNTSYGRVWDPSIRTPNGMGESRFMEYDEMVQRMYGDVGGLVQDGLITAVDGAAMIKENAARADRSGIDFGMAVGMVDKVASGGQLDNADVTQMSDSTLQTTGPYQLIGQRHEAVRIMGPEMNRRIETAYRQNGPDSREFIQQIAAAAARRDLAGSLPELNAGLNAGNVESIRVGGPSGRTVTEWEEHFRATNNPIFIQYRREYGQAAQGPQGP